LQQCNDLNGFYGEWYDSDGPYFDCDWYGSSSTFCSSYGNSYENFGFTANQACCACGGGGVVVDIMVVSTVAACVDVGGTYHMKNKINLSVFQTNLALSKSGSNSRLRLVYIHDDTSYDDFEEQSGQAPLDHLMSTFAVLRLTVGADIVVILQKTDRPAGPRTLEFLPCQTARALVSHTLELV
jgi:hypothetical protein